MYGLKQAARLAYEGLKLNLGEAGYCPDKITPNIWTHETRKTKFCLCVDDFGVKYFSQANANHLKVALTKNYEITTDDEGKHFCGLNLNWNSEQSFVDISMKDSSKH